jgi:hypothetical protein
MDSTVIKCKNCSAILEEMKGRLVNIMGNSICSYADPDSERHDHVAE